MSLERSMIECYFLKIEASFASTITWQYGAIGRSQKGGRMMTEVSMWFHANLSAFMWFNVNFLVLYIIHLWSYPPSHDTAVQWHHQQRKNCSKSCGPACRQYPSTKFFCSQLMMMIGISRIFLVGWNSVTVILDKRK